MRCTDSGQKQSILTNALDLLQEVDLLVRLPVKLFLVRLSVEFCPILPNKLDSPTYCKLDSETTKPECHPIASALSCHTAHLFRLCTEALEAL